MNNGIYGITQHTGKYDGEFDADNYAPDPENTPLFCAIFWTLVVSVSVCIWMGWMI